MSSKVLLLATLIAILYHVAAVVVQDSEMIDYINNQRKGWRAGINDKFNNTDLSEAVALLGLEPSTEDTSEPIVQSPGNVPIPAEFDARKKWPQCALAIRDQKRCGGCYAFAATGVFDFRMCIASQGAVDIDTSPQSLISCNTETMGCKGGTLSSSWRFYASNGAVLESDYPFTSGLTGATGTCALKSSFKRFYASSSVKYMASVYDMQYEIMTNGPIQVGFKVFNDFFNYKSGVYSYTVGAFSGGHSVYLVGWGEDGYGTPYWIAVNSWGPNWGMSGVFYIRRGTDECGMETYYRPIAPTVTVPATTRAPTTTTRAPTTTTTKAPAAPSPTYNTRGCWTCPAGYIHWFQAGVASAPHGDQCACVPLSWVSTTTTRAPTTTTTTRTPTTTTTTRAPTTTTTTTTTRASTTTTTTRAPATSSSPTYDTRGCWTCPAGYIHWFQAGVASAPHGDQCACVPLSWVSTTTTRAPTTTTTTTTTRAPTTTTTTTTKAPVTTSSPTYDTRGCWTCYPGYIHWFQAGLASAPHGDRCACVPLSFVSTTTTRAPTTTTRAPTTTTTTTTTRAPTTTTTTTRAPTTTTTTRAPATSSSPTYDTRGCWTCPAGYIHWFQAGVASAPHGDQCACVPLSWVSTTTTRAPTTTTTTRAPTTTTTTRVPATSSSPTYDTRGCWTCYPGYIHWFQAGFTSAPNGDKCACVPLSQTRPHSSTTTTRSPATTTRAPTTSTTRAPTSDPCAPSTRAGTRTSTEAPSCPTYWSRLGNTCYKISGQQASFDEARSLCEKQNARLVEITTPEQNQFILSQVNPRNTQSAFLAIKAVNQEMTSLYGSKLSFENWRGGVERSGCAVMIRDPVSSNVGKWKTEDCDVARTFICELKL